jgi:hypothetical protein
MIPEPQVVGEIYDESINFRFRVKAFRKMSNAEVRSLYLEWYHNHRDKRKSLRNKEIIFVTYFGGLGGYF